LLTKQQIRIAAIEAKTQRIMLTEEDFLKAARELQTKLQRQKDNRVERTHRTLIIAQHTESLWEKLL